MPSSRNESQVQWSGTDAVTLSTNNARSVSDALALNVEDWDAELVINADNAGTPASGDTVDIYIHYSAGDVLGDSGDDYPTNEYAEFLCRLDTYGSNAPGEDPARRAIPIRTAAKAIKLSAEGPQVASRNITLRARLITHRGQ